MSMVIGAGIVFGLVMAGVIVLDVFLLGKNFDRRINSIESTRERRDR